MKRIYKSLLFLLPGFLLSGIAIAQNAAQDTLLNRQVLLEREFNPTLQDASKINTVPAVHEPAPKQVNIQYETQHPYFNFDRYSIGDTGSGDIRTSVDYDKKRGYLNFGAGNYANIKGNLGYKIVDTKNDQFDIFGSYNSTDGKIKYAEKEYGLEDMKAKYSDIFVKGRYKHIFEPLTWHLDVSYNNVGFNYYGNPFSLGNNFEFDKKQSVDIIHAGTGIQSKDNDVFRYSGFIKFDHFSSKYGPTINDDGVSGNIINAGVDLSAPFSSGTEQIGVRVGIMNESFGDVKFMDNQEKDEHFHSLTNIKANPYFYTDRGELQLNIGVNIEYAIDNKNKMVIAPDVKLSYLCAENTSLYVNATGGINENTYVDILRENRYVYQGRKINYSRTAVDAIAGIKSGIVSGFEFDIFAGYKYTMDEHFYSTHYTGSFGNVGYPIYQDLSTGKFGGLIKTNLIPLTNLSAKLTGYFYSVSGSDELPEKAWNRPTMTLELNADIHPTNNFTLSASYLLATGRKALDNIEERSMKDISELNVRAEYRFFDWLSANVKANNLLNQKYETWYGYTHQGLNVMGGVSLKF